MKRLLVTFAIVAVAVAATACISTQQTTPAAPTSTTSSSSTDVSKVLTTGTWASASTAPTFSPSTCGNFQWTIASMTATSATGTFKAVCGGGLTLDGNGPATLNGASATLLSTGTAPAPGLSCPFTLTATGVPTSTTAISLTYAGTVCGVPMSGTEIINRK